ncbi:hypothetical protein [Clostridium haemolyticum]|nr:hypothetical protein [Clostridium haemolyticum]
MRVGMKVRWNKWDEQYNPIVRIKDSIKMINRRNIVDVSEY